MDPHSKTPAECECCECDGAGGHCGVSGESPDNCPVDHDCEVAAWVECRACRGAGVVEDDDGDDDD